MTSCNFGTLHSIRIYFFRQPSHRLKWQEDRTGDRWTLKSFTDKLIPPYHRSLETISESLIKKPEEYLSMR